MSQLSHMTAQYQRYHEALATIGQKMVDFHAFVS